MSDQAIRRREPDLKIRVLIVEDSRADAELMLAALRGTGTHPAALVVQEESEFRRALADFRPDVVLADNRLPRFSGRRALLIARRHDPTLPVIMVTGTLREDRIARLMRVGLSEYVLKDQLVRLGPVVTQALARAEAQRAMLRSARALEASERRFRAVADASGDGLLIADRHGVLVYCNAAAERMFGYPPGALSGVSLARLVPQAWRERQETGWHRALESGAPLLPCNAEIPALRADGTEFPVEVTVSGWEEDGGRFFSAQVRDITVRREEARQRLVLAQAVEQTVTSVVITDTDGTIQYVNPAFERLTGYEAHEVLGKTPRILKSGKQPPEFYQDLWARITAGEVFRGEFTNLRKDGSEYRQESTIFPVVGEGGRIERFVGLGHDVTQERLLEEQVRQSQKMEAIGQVAAGVAHDFNNVLTGVLTNAQLLGFSLPEGPSEQRECLDDLEAAARRGADLVKRLMSLSRRGEGTRRRVDVRSVVDEAMKTIRRIVPESIEISVEQAPQELPCLLDDGELVHALLNLATNARDALPKGGRLAIRTHMAGGLATVEVRDNGLGMEPEVLERVFEPFFTTKETGKGTGLGLAMVYAFARRSGGSITARSEPGVGTTMRPALPLAREATRSEEVSAPGSAEPTSASAQGTVVLAEDDAGIRRVAQRVLERVGYRVLAAGDGVEALTLLARERGRVDLVVADLVMPRGGGGMLVRNTLDWPDRPRFLLMSGYTPAELNGDEDLLRQVPFLPKPWNVPDLEAAVAKVMAPEAP